VRTLRTLADSRAIVELASRSRRAAVIGSSFIGLEVAASLRQRGLEVSVVGPDRVPLARVLGDALGAFVKQKHEEHGVHFRLGQRPKAIVDDGVELENGERLAADLVVAGIGVVPRVALAESAGLEVSNGIVVDGRLRTSDERIYAAGDVARYPDAWSGENARIEHFVVAERQGQAAARAILGGDGYRDVPFFWSQHYDVTIASVGYAAGWDRIEARGSLADGSYAGFYLKAGRVRAVVTVGRDTLSLRVEAAMQAGDEAALAGLLAE
jgi:NADPH-dependent 2,4-dienoyl-CoA reductase/sulfur reductase-like enzyme